MPSSMMHPLLKEGLEDLKAAQAQQLEGFEKILVVLGSTVTSTPLTADVEETKKAPAKKTKAPAKKTKEPAAEEPEADDGPTIQDIRKMLQGDVPRKIGIELIEEFVPKGKRAILSNVPKNLYEKFAEAIQAKAKELEKS